MMTYALKYRYISPYILEISWPAEIDEKILWEIIQLKGALRDRWKDKLLNLAMGYHRLSLHFRSEADFSLLLSEIEEIRTFIPFQSFPQRKRWHIPVCYDLSLGKDLKIFADVLRLEVDEVIRLHQSATYLLFFYGFLPGFMYLGGLSEKLFHSRKAIPERKVEKGSVAIGGKQTGIYPLESPGGWWIIGRTPVGLFDFRSKNINMAQPGDEVRFEIIDLALFEHMQKEADAGRYTLNHETIHG